MGVIIDGEYVFGSELPSRMGFIELVYLSSGGGYDWHDAAVWYDPQTRRYFYDESGGCACNAFYDAFDLNARETYPSVSTKQDALRVIDGFAHRDPLSQDARGFPPEEIARAKQAIRDFKPSAHKETSSEQSE